MTRPLAIDLCSGLGGWTDGLLAEGWDCVGYDIERHKYGSHQYPAQLVLQDILTLDGRQFRGHASLIVASPPCQEFSYMAMPWTRAKQIAQALYARKLCDYGPPFPDGYTGSRTVAELTALFDACVRIGREAECPIVIENVRGAIPWVGRSRWNYGSFYLWGDVPALMPITLKRPTKSSGGSWFNVAHNTESGTGQNPDGRLGNHGRDEEIKRERGVKGFTPNGGPLGKNELGRKHGSKSSARKAASARIAKIPFALASHIARVYHP